jgi:hypothetical protein
LAIWISGTVQEAGRFGKRNDIDERNGYNHGKRMFAQRKRLGVRGQVLVESTKRPFAPSSQYINCR